MQGYDAANHSVKRNLIVTVGKAGNEWIKKLSIEGWIYGEKANKPAAEAKFGNVTFTYSKEKDGTYTTEVPTEAGIWYVKATVEGTGNYTDLEAVKEFEILEEAVSQSKDDETADKDKNNTDESDKNTSEKSEEKKGSGTKNNIETGETADVFMLGSISILSAIGILITSLKGKRRK